MKKYLLSLAVVGLILIQLGSLHAQFAVIDAGNIIQSTLTAANTAANAASSAAGAASQANIDATQTAALAKQLQQYATQIQQYQTEFQQLQNMIQNTTSLTSFSIPNSIGSVSSVQGAGTTLNSTVGGASSYVSQFKTLQQYIAGGLTTNNPLLQQARQAANADAVTTASQQQAAIQADANNIGQLGTAAQGANGALQVGQANAQLLAALNNQQLQIRALQAQQAQAAAARDQATADQQAAGEAAIQAAWQPDPNISSMSTLQFK